MSSVRPFWALFLLVVWSGAQTASINGSSEGAVTAVVRDNRCYPVTKCKPCSKFESHTPECLKTGYKQTQYCADIKKERLVGCHYSPDYSEERVFWVFEFFCALVGAIAYAVVYLRRRSMEKMLARRIQRQINA